MENWLNQYGFFLGNALLSGMGLAFAVGAPARIKFRTAKNWWIVLWASLLGIYLGWVILPVTSMRELLVFIFNGVSTSASAMLYLYFRDKGRLKTRKSIIVFCSVFLLIALSGLLSLTIYTDLIILAGFIGRILAWIFFVLLAWNYRKQHMSTTLLLLAYANLQLPSGLIGKQGWGNDFVLLLVGKLSLIGAMYHTLGVRDAKS